MPGGGYQKGGWTYPVRRVGMPGVGVQGGGWGGVGVHYMIGIPTHPGHVIPTHRLGIPTHPLC